MSPCLFLSLANELSKSISYSLKTESSRRMDIAKMKWTIVIFGVIAALILGLRFAASLRVAQIEASAPPEGQIIEVDGHRLHAVTRGAGPDLVLIHGASGSVRDFTFDLVDRLAASFRVIAIDRPGFGWSAPFEDGSGGSLQQQAAILSAAARTLGAERPIVLGHSYGGAVALAWALERPEALSGVVTLAAPMHMWEGEPPLLHRISETWIGRAAINPAIFALVPTEYVRAQIAGVFAPQAQPDGYADHFVPLMSARPATLFANGRQRVTLKDEIRAMIPRYSQIEVPVEMVHGTADRTVWIELHAERVAPMIERANLTILEGIGHMPHHAAAAEIVQVITARFK